jgi:hypothetical protein
MRPIGITLSVGEFSINWLDPGAYKILNDHEVCRLASLCKIVAHSLEWERASRVEWDGEARNRSPLTEAPLNEVFNSIESTATRIKNNRVADIVPPSPTKWTTTLKDVCANLFELDSSSETASNEAASSEVTSKRKRKTNYVTQCTAFAVIFDILGMEFLFLLLYTAERPYGRISTSSFGRLVQWMVEQRDTLSSPRLKAEAKEKLPGEALLAIRLIDLLTLFRRHNTERPSPFSRGNRSFIHFGSSWWLPNAHSCLLAREIEIDLDALDAQWRASRNHS